MRCDRGIAHGPCTVEGLTSDALHRLAQRARRHEQPLAGSLAEARNMGWLRSEGKEYVVQEGDVMEFLFNV